MIVNDNAKSRSKVGIIHCTHKSIQIHTKCLYINYLVTIYLEAVQQTTYALFALANLEG